MYLVYLVVFLHSSWAEVAVASHHKVPGSINIRGGREGGSVGKIIKAGLILAKAEIHQITGTTRVGPGRLRPRHHTTKMMAPEVSAHTPPTTPSAATTAASPALSTGISALHQIFHSFIYWI